PMIKRMKQLEEKKFVKYKPRQRLNEKITNGTCVSVVSRDVLVEAELKQGEKSSRKGVDDFVQNAEGTVICSGGIGANFELIRKNWPKRLGTAPQNMIAGVPDYVDGRMLGEAENIGANIVNRDRMRHYTEGIQNWNPIW